jgi:hypothetical protein
MKKLFAVSAVGFVICLFLSSCADDNPVSTVNNDIRPLVIGNYWKYQTDRYVTYDQLYYDTMRVVSYENLNGNPAYGVLCNNSYKIYFINKSDGLYCFEKTLHDTAYEYTPKLYIKYPINVNDTIVSPFTANLKCVSLTAAFNGTTGCIDFVPTGIQGSVTNYHEYWKPGIGLIGACFDYANRHYMNTLKDYGLQ